MWGATISCIICLFNIGISIHAPRVGSDDFWSFLLSSDLVFQSTLPVWGATAVNVIHAAGGRFQSTLPVWGATRLPRAAECRPCNFNPRSPCGERRKNRNALRSSMRFQSTLPVWGATDGHTEYHIGERISIHAPRVGSDGNLPIFRT